MKCNWKFKSISRGNKKFKQRLPPLSMYFKGNYLKYYFSVTLKG